jgi:carbamoyl-phosphate synthase small subunit
VFYSLPADVDVIHINLDDDTVAVLHRMTLPFYVQNHPESAPGPHDSEHLSARFNDLMKKNDRFRIA